MAAILLFFGLPSNCFLALALEIQKNIIPWTKQKGLICKQTKIH